MLVNVGCPGCHTNQDVGQELIGRYTLCQKCGCRFYVVVPPLGDRPAEHQERTSKHAAPQGTKIAQQETTVNDLLQDSQKGEAVILKVLRQQQQLLIRLCLAMAVATTCAVLSTIMLAWILWHP